MSGSWAPPLVWRDRLVARLERGALLTILQDHVLVSCPLHAMLSVAQIWVQVSLPVLYVLFEQITVGFAWNVNC